jgi:hypothetical protein
MDSLEPRQWKVGNVAHMGKIRYAYKILFRKPERKRPEDLDLDGKKKI